MKRFSIMTILCWGMLTAIAGANETPSHDTIRLTNGEWPPYLSERLPHYGIASRITTAAFELSGIQVQYGFFLWKRAYDQAKVGRWDGSIGWSKNKEREQHFYISDPIFKFDYVFFHLRSFDFDWQTLDDLADISVGGTLSYNYGDAVHHAEANGTLKLHRVAKDELNFRKLIKGKIDLFLQDRLVGYSMLREEFADFAQQVTHHPRPVVTHFGHLLLSKKLPENQQRLQLFNKGLRQLRQSGQIDQFFQEMQTK